MERLPEVVSRKYRFIPANVEVDEHHIGVYASETDGHMVKVTILGDYCMEGTGLRKHSP